MLTADEVIQQISETLAEASGEFIAGIANQVLTKKVKYNGDSLFVVTNAVKAEYTSVWDDGARITTSCLYNPDTKTVSDIEDSGVDTDAGMDDEYVTLTDGTELREKDGVTFDY